MSASGRTTRSKAQQGALDTDKGDAMEGIASTAVSKDSTETSFRFEDNEDGFEIVKSKNKKREELKIKKEKLQQTYKTNRPKSENRRQPQPQQPVFRLAHNHGNNFSPYGAAGTSRKKKTTNSSTPKNDEKKQVSLPADGPLPELEKQQQVQLPINVTIKDTQNAIDPDQSMLIDQHVDPDSPTEKKMNDDNALIVINKSDTWKATCAIPESEKSSRFCNYIIKLVNEKIDVVVIGQEKKVLKTGETQQKTHVISVKVGTEQELQRLLELDFSLLLDGEDEPTKYRFTKVENMMEKRRQLLQTRENRTIKVFNIPLHMENSSLKAVFSRYGELEEDAITMRLKGIYRQAFITYKDEQSLNIFYEKWGVWAFKEFLMVVPCLLSEDKRDERQQFMAKINGLPLNVCARNLQGLFNEINAASIFILKNPITYNPMRYAFIYFKNEDDFAIATSNVYTYSGHQLEWSSAEEKSCHRRQFNSYADVVSKSGHNGANSNTNNTNRPNRRVWNKNNIRPNNTSYVFDEENAAEWGDEEEYSDNNNIQGETKQGGSMHETKGKDKESSCGLNDVKEQLSNLTKMIGEFKKENEVVKSEISDMKQKLNNQGAKKLTIVKPIMNNNNKRVKESSSSESENNNIIFNLETRVEKQDQLLTNMYNMINRIAESISDNENDNKKQNNKAVSNIGVIGGSSNVNANNNH
ncbi:hypothetical protein RhiirA5_383563 [Rhizophagus irregularis]|uniref:RRM domain-containing protein n=1 Tax=Rhizophagus irregularis TaxID=588596 RepID=A0A2N0NWJ5_9GLOM|nr:hypothetical protein RhiirA5_383563 [Rhizophagus irregularis]